MLDRCQNSGQVFLFEKEKERKIITTLTNRANTKKANNNND